MANEHTTITSVNNDYDLYTSAATILNYSYLGLASRRVLIRVAVGDGAKGASTTPALWTVNLTIANQVVLDESLLETRGADRFAFELGPFMMPTGSVVLTLQSPVSDDTDVDVTVDVLELDTTIDTVTTNTDMLTPAAVYAEFISGTNEDAFKADLSGVPAAVYAEFISGTNEDAFKADLSGVPAAVYAEFISGSNEDAFKADLSGLVAGQSALAAGISGVPAAVYGEFTSGSNEDAFKADVSGVPAAVVSAMGTGAFLTEIPWNSDWDSEVQSEVFDCLTTDDFSGIVGTDSLANYIREIKDTGIPGLAMNQAALGTAIAALPADTYAEFTSGSNEDAFKADVTSVTVGDIVPAALAKFATEDTGEVAAAAGSVAELSKGSGGGGSPLSGARSVTITVDDGTDPIEGALVRVTNGLQTEVRITDVNGEVTFSLDDLTWTVTITKAGYTFSPVPLVIAADTSVTYSMAAVVITPAAMPGIVAAYLTAMDHSGDVEGQLVNVRMTAAPADTDGVAFIEPTAAGRTDVNGVFQFNAYQGATYEITIGTKTLCVTIPSDASDPYELEDSVLVCAEDC